MLRRSLGVLGRILGVLGRILGVLGRILGLLGRILGVLGCILGVLVRILGMLERIPSAPVGTKLACAAAAPGSVSLGCYTRDATHAPVQLDMLRVGCWKQQVYTSIYIYIYILECLRAIMHER